MLATGERVERELRDRHNRSFFLRILPYRAKGTVAGVVLTLIDVSGLKAAEDALFHERYLLNSLLGWGWVDSVVALVIAVFAVREGIEALHGDTEAEPVSVLTGEKAPDTDADPEMR